MWLHMVIKNLKLNNWELLNWEFETFGSAFQIYWENLWSDAKTAHF